MIVVGLYFYIFYGEFSRNIEDWSGFGEYVGGTLGTILSVIALIVVVKTYNLQAEELLLTRQELKGSKEALQDQIKVSNYQRVENTFFNLLREKNSFLNSDTGKESYRIRINNLYANVLREVKAKKTSEEETVRRIRRVYLTQHHNDLKNVFSLNDAMFRLISDSNLDEKEKYLYYSILIGNMAKGEAELYTAYTLINEFPAPVYKAIEDSNFFDKVSVKKEWREFMSLINNHLLETIFN